MCNSSFHEAKALGLKMGDPFYQVKDILEKNNVAVFSSNYNLYGDMSNRVMSLLSRYTPKLTQYSIDEAFLDLSGMDNLHEYGKEIVRKVSKGTGIPVSLGIAPTKTLVKMASKYAKKYKGYESVCLIDTEEKREKTLKLFEVGDVWGIGHRNTKKLECYGIKTAWDLTQESASWVRKELSVTGLRTWKELHGESFISIEELPYKQSICTSRSFPGIGLDKLQDLEEAVANFAASCSRKLRENHIACKNMTVFVYTSRFRTNVPEDYISSDIIFPVATNNHQELVAYAVQALRRYWKGDGKYQYKKTGVIVWDICRDNEIQGNLFDKVNWEKQRKLMVAIDEINKKNGHDTIRISTQGYSKNWHLKSEYLSHFLIAAIIINEEDLTKVKEGAESVRKKYFQTGEMKSSNIKNNHKRRRIILENLKDLPFNIYLFVADKRKLYEQSGLRFKPSFYKFLNQRVYHELHNSFQELTIVADETGRDEFMESFANYVKQRNPNITLFDQFNFRFDNSQHGIFIQIADLIAGSLAYSFDEKKKEKSDNMNYKSLLGKKILCIDEFPKDYQNYSIAKSSYIDNDVDRKIAEICYRKAMVFKNQNEHSLVDEEVRMQLTVLNYLLFRFVHNSIRTYIPTKEIINQLELCGFTKMSTHTFRNKIRARLRDKGVIISSSPKGYKIPSKMKEIEDFLVHGKGIIEPMLSRLKMCYDAINLGSNGSIKILDAPEYSRLKQIMGIEDNISEDAIN